MDTLLVIVSSKLIWVLLFLVLAGIGAIQILLKRGSDSPEKNSLESTVASFAGMELNPEDIEENTETEKSLYKIYYSKGVPRRGNIKRIIWTEKHSMEKRAEETARKELAENEQHDVR